MIEQLLDFARVRQGRGIELQLRPTHLERVAQQVVQEVEAANPGAAIEVRASGDLSGVWDADRLAQALTNLAANAVQHGRADTPASIELEGTAAEVVVARIRNVGGIPGNALPKLFEPFRRAVSSTTTGGRRPGLGLGLFITREIVRAHGGDIVLDAAAPDMTVFEVKLPRHARSEVRSDAAANTTASLRP